MAFYGLIKVWTSSMRKRLFGPDEIDFLCFEQFPRLCALAFDQFARDVDLAEPNKAGFYFRELHELFLLSKRDRHLLRPRLRCGP